MSKIKETVEHIIKVFTNENFLLFIKGVLTLRDEVIKVDPEEVDPGLVDLIMDENMFSWAVSAVGREPTKYDWEAASYIAADLQEILNNLNDE